MIDGIGDATSIALAGLQRASGRIAGDASAIAAGGVAPPLTGSRPTGAAGQVFQALESPSGNGLGGNGLGGNGLVGSVVDLNAAKFSYEANAKVLAVVNNLQKQALNLIS